MSARAKPQEESGTMCVLWSGRTVVQRKTGGVVSRAVDSAVVHEGEGKAQQRADLAKQSGAITPNNAHDMPAGALAAGTGRMSQMPACSSDLIRRTGEWSQGSQLDWRRGLLSASSGLAPLASLSRNIVSSKLSSHCRSGQT